MYVSYTDPVFHDQGFQWQGCMAMLIDDAKSKCCFCFIKKYIQNPNGLKPKEEITMFPLHAHFSGIFFLNLFNT